MTQIQLEDHQKVKFNNFIDAIYFRDKCPVCSATLLNDCVFKSDDPKYSFLVGNSFLVRNIKVHSDGYHADIAINKAILSRSDVFYYSFSMGCKSCYEYSHSFKLTMFIGTDPIYIKNIELNSITLKLDDNMVLQTNYINSSSRLYIDKKDYSIDFIDIDPYKQKELANRFSIILAFM